MSFSRRTPFVVGSFLAVLLATCLFVGGCIDQTPKEPPKSDTTSEGKKPTMPEHSGQTLHIPADTTPRQLLEKTAAAYKTAFSYSDHGLGRAVAKMLDPEAEPQPWPCTVAFQKPGKLRLEIGDGQLVSDGDDCFAQIRLLADQVLRFPTPEKWSLENMFQDVFLDRSMESGIPETILRFPPQLILLFADDPVKTLLPEGAVAEFREPQRIGDIPCDLIRITDQRGSRLLWISRKNHALLRFDYFVEGVSVPEGVDTLRLVRIEMTDAKFNWEIAPEAFQMQQPRDARQVSEFQPSETTLLGRVPDNAASVLVKDLADRNSSKVRSATVTDWAGKTVVLGFWSAGSEASRGALAEMLKSRETFQTDDRVLFLPINLDGVASENAPDDEIRTLLDRDRQVLDDWRLPLEPALDLEGRLAKALRIDTLPSIVVLGPKGTTEYYVREIVASANLSEMVRAILGGEKPYEKGLALFEQQRKEHLSLLKQMVEKDFYALTPPPENRAAAKPMASKEPARLRLTRLWYRALTGTGQVTVLEPLPSETGERSPSRLLVPCEGNLLAVIDLAGNVLKKVKPVGLLDDELLTLVRTGFGAGGKPCIGVSSVSGRAVHVYDEHLEPVFAYHPDEAVKRDGRCSPKQFVADFRFVDVYGNGTPALLLGVITLDGTAENRDSLRAVDFQGKEIWRDRLDVTPLQVESRLSDGQRSILLLGTGERRSSLLRYDSQGKRLGEILVGEDRQVLWFDVDDPGGEGRSEVCLISADRNRNDVRVDVLDQDDRIRWSRPLPTGEYRKTTEQIASGNLLGDEAEEWLLQGPDGTVLVFDRNGEAIDSFSFGKHLTGLAVLQLADKRLLVISDLDGVSAWEVAEKP